MCVSIYVRLWAQSSSKHVSVYVLTCRHAEFGCGEGRACVRAYVCVCMCLCVFVLCITHIRTNVDIARYGNRLAVVKAFNFGDKLLVPLQEISQLQHQIAPCCACAFGGVTVRVFMLA